METIVSATCSTSNVGSTLIEPSGWWVPCADFAVIGVAALPMSIWPHATLYLRPSSEVDLVRPVMACLVDVYGAESGRGTWAEIEPLLMIRPPMGSCAFMILIASWVQRNVPVRLVSTTRCQSS